MYTKHESVFPSFEEGGRAELLMPRYLKKSARPGRSDTIASRIASRTASMFLSDLPGCALLKVA